MRPLLAFLLLTSMLAAAPTAAAAEPIMPLSQVRAGMQCTALSVVRGTAVTSFDARVIDVVADSGAGQPFLLVELGGAAIATTGIGPGFSGSPVVCPDEQGVGRIAGAISESVGAYGGTKALATPIERVLGTPVQPPSSVRLAPRTVRAGRSLAGPLSISGLSPALAAAVTRVAARNGRQVLTTPGAPRQAPLGPAEPPVPGSAMGVSYATGDLSIGAVGTVAYVDGDRLWGFGHPFDGAGARSLFLQRAYVYDVINNPTGSSELQTYKLASPFGELGRLTSDGASAVAGLLGAATPATPMLVVARDRDRGTQRAMNIRLADESAVGRPAGTSAFSGVAPLAVAQAAYDALGAWPARQSGNLCLRVTVAGREEPLRFCNTYVGAIGGAAGVTASPMVGDVAAAGALLDGYRFGPLRITKVVATVSLRRALRQAYLVGVRGPRVLRAGRTATLTLRLRRVDGATSTRRVRVRIPAALAPGQRRVVLTGTPADVDAFGGSGGGGTTTIDLGPLLADEGADDAGSDDPGPRSLDELARAFARLKRDDGVAMAFPAPGQSVDDVKDDRGARSRRAYRDGALRISGRASYVATVR